MGMLITGGVGGSLGHGGAVSKTGGSGGRAVGATSSQEAAEAMHVFTKTVAESLFPEGQELRAVLLRKAT